MAMPNVTRRPGVRVVLYWERSAVGDPGAPVPRQVQWVAMLECGHRVVVSAPTAELGRLSYPSRLECSECAA